MQATLSAQSSIFVAPRLSKAASTSKVTTCAPARAAQPVRCMAFDAKKAAQTTVSTAASLALLVSPAMAEYSISDDLKGLFDAPKAAVEAVEAKVAAPTEAPPAKTIKLSAAKPAPALAEISPAESEELKIKALALKAELQAGLGKPVEVKKVKNFTKPAPVEPTTYQAPAAPKVKEEGGDPSFLVAMLVLFSPFLLVTGYNVVNLVGAVNRKLN
uniref:Uncharacterized protein n=1 Tax=Pyramimonas obovata TaxID=1411642 RepID=A0A7S0WJ65_9CHLO|mmetsp:Transcript_27151/g.59336  ORF Transcript_27151/g.59336 Transcript_27151/m.59336 type:complete len:215 (+) Transcript_27151:119-763(+)|eukprot:CAMPEP_0118956614 /NCGR_PEP_ID=MMETSP1169-20130426/61668_1 /TAXON_ID=36882 /ORGANISM="Pyramimonas obovata, Strain CCMP722" /LENGTH=214 /DNA_ID=CAMNT_0006904651 /DNA_START=781 /DNA_END=1425 /DNA_ORIENTATION=-